jgi:hypothetical protein
MRALRFEADVGAGMSSTTSRLLEPRLCRNALRHRQVRRHAHPQQVQDQLGEPARAAFIGTVGSIISFSIGARDAEALAPDFSL